MLTLHHQERLWTAMAAAEGELPAPPTLQDLVLRSLKRTYDMFSVDGVTSQLPAFLPR
jgi:hypothetical protein